MTASTEQERAEFQEWALINMDSYRTPEWMFLKNKSGEYAHFDVNLVWSVWQAARRAPAAPKAAPISDELPQGFISDVLTAAGLVRHGKQCKALADRLGDAIEKIWTTSIAQRKAIAAAPQPPEVAQSNSAEFDGIKTKAAPVQMPEPVAIITDTVPREPGWKTMFVPDSGTRLYTEQQVRQLLAAHDIQGQST